LESFSMMAKDIDKDLSVQEKYGFIIYDWNDDKTCLQAFRENPPHVILECFQCGRPEWLERLLFDEKIENISHIINVEYLTAEDWADDFHLLKSATRSARVKKINFMPGFTNKTGGLTLDKDFIKARKEGFSKIENKDLFTITIFSYERDFLPVVKAFEKYQNEKRKENPNFKIQVILAAGKSLIPFKNAWNHQNKPFEIKELPFLKQEDWDKELCFSNFNFIRGEDSLSRACLAGLPFIWHAYPQEDEWQTVKAKALLERMKEYFSEDEYKIYSELMLEYNKDFPNIEKEETLIFQILEHYNSIKKTFHIFSEKLIENGNMAENLLDYISRLQFK
nr:elongation factor P maturation arginine rhamnosyltransferase EarP [Treponema sp.]